jgi:thiol:disulfide interchange protein DsbD
MIPILSSIIVGQGDSLTTRRAFTLSLVYVLAMALTYTFAGVIAGLFGANLQAAFQNPIILSVFSGIFVLLALSMFGFYELQLPSSLQSKLASISNNQQSGSLAGVAIMGLLSALIVGPCVAPPLMGALIYIGQTGDAVLGGIALFSLSMGMGAPLLLIGTSAGKFLPRAGGWMDAVKAVFGVALLAVAIWMLERILPSAIIMTLWAVLLITSSIYMGTLETLTAGASGWKKLWKGLGMILLLQGAMILAGVAMGNSDPLQPLKGTSVQMISANGQQTMPSHVTFKKIKGVSGLEQAIKEANAAGKGVMLDFYADWCISCKEFEKYTFSNPGVISSLANVVTLQADVTANDDEDQALLKSFKLIGPPAILFFGKDGAEYRNHRVVGYMEADNFKKQVDSAFSQ